jgi:hypothetical protein
LLEAKVHLALGQLLHRLATTTKRLGFASTTPIQSSKTDCIKKFKRYKFQVNKGVDNPTLKTLADKNSHEVWSQADMPVDDGDPEEVANNLFDDLEKNLKK